MGMTELRRSILLNTPHLETASGDIASFQTDMKAPLNSLIISFSAEQDLHGYDYPWVAGGNKNLIPDGTDTSKGFLSSYLLKSDGTTETSNYYNVTEYFQITAEETYTWSCLSSTINLSSVCFYDENKEFISGIAAEQSLPKTITAPLGAVYCRTVQGKDFSERGCQLEVGSTATTIKPYSNICPINGFVGTDIYDDPDYGKVIYWNQMVKNGDFSSGTTTGWSFSTYLKGTVADGVMSTSATTSSNRQWYVTASSIEIILGNKYLICGNYRNDYGGGDGDMRTSRVSFGSTAVKSLSVPELGSVAKLDSIINSTVNATSIRIGTSGSVNPSAGHAMFSVWDIMVCDLTKMFGKTVADSIYDMERTTAGSGVAWFKNLFPKTYYQYNAGENTCVSAVNGNPYRHYYISWQNDADTVYTGTLTVNNDGSADVEATFGISLGSASWTKWAYYSNGGYFRTELNSTIKRGYNGVVSSMKCSMLRTLAPNNIQNYSCNLTTDTNPRIVVKDTSLNGNVTNFKAKYADAQFVYELKTPITYHLTNVEKIKALIGENKISSNIGTASLEYWKH